MSELDEIKKRKMEKMLKRKEETPPAIIVKVFGAPISSSCCGPTCSTSNCGPSISFEDVTKELDTRLHEVFGNIVKTEYIDLIKRVNEYPQVLNIIQTRRLPLPLIMINGEPKFAGGIAPQKIIQEIEKLRKI